MEIIQIVGIAITTTIFLIILRQKKPVLALLLSLAFSTIIFILMMDKLGSIISVMKELSRRAGINYFFLDTVLKILGIAYLGEFAAIICKDAGESAVAKKVEFAAKIIIAILTLPIMVAILESLMNIMPG